MVIANQQEEADNTTPRKVIIKTMTVNKNTGTVFEFFSNVKNMESGGILKDTTKGEGGWWKFKNLKLLQERQSLNLIESNKN